MGNLYKKEEQSNENSPNIINYKCLVNLTKDSFFDYYYNNSFAIYNSIIDFRLYLVYTNENRSIISFDIIDERKICEIKKAHNSNITSIRYYLDKRLNRDLILTLSSGDNNIKIWCFNYIGCIANIRNACEIGECKSCCLLNDNNQIYVVTSAFIWADERAYEGSIKILSFNEEIYKKMNDASYSTSVIDVYYDNNISKTFIIAGSKGFIQSYDYKNNQKYHIYKYDDKRYRYNIIINNNGEMTQLIETSDFGLIRIWNFHSGQLLTKIKLYEREEFLSSICLWDNNNLLIGCRNGKIKIININKKKLIKEFDACKNIVINIKKINHSKYGECLISQGERKEPIKIWGIDNNNDKAKE